jgi:hypothetical protein
MWTKETKRLMKKWAKQHIELTQNRYDVCEENAEVRAILDRSVVDGKYGVIVSGRDCDCSAYHRESVREAPRSVIEFKREWDEHCEWLDGPESQRFVRPDQIDSSVNYSRDLALEAYEDGHPHVIYDIAR